MNMQNRQPRVVTRLPVVETESSATTYYTKNLSMGGLFLLTDKRWAVGSELRLAVAFGRVRLPFLARVTHLQRDGVGMCFVDPSDEVRQALRKVIATQIPQNNAPSTMETLQRAVGLGKARGPVVAWTDGKIRHESVVRNLSAQGGFFETDEQPRPGTAIMVYVPQTVQNDDDEIEHELKGSTAEVTTSADDGFEARFTTPSAEFRMAVDRLLRDFSRG